jgi:N-acyl-L-homoserine lactone synthetase
MLQLITPEWHSDFHAARQEMHRLRYRVFHDRLRWVDTRDDGLEIDAFDGMDPSYLLQRGLDGRVQGCVRLLPSLGPTMLGQVFPDLLDGKPMPASPSIWESSRFAIDLPENAQDTVGGIARPTVELFASMIEFGLSRALIDIVTVTDLRVERILRRAGWPLRRLAEPKTIGVTIAVAGYLEVSIEALASVRRAGGITEPMLWAPVMPAAE